MIRELKPSLKYGRVVSVLSLLSLFFGALYGFIGEFSLPLASPFLAVLFVFEKPGKRFLSYLVPIAIVGINVALHSIYMLFSLEIVILALIIALCYRFSETKNTTSVYLTLTVAIFIIGSIYVSGARSVGSFDPSVITDHYASLYTEFKYALAHAISLIQVEGRDGSLSQVMNELQARELIESYSKLAVAYVGVASFLIAGVSLKIFCAAVFKISRRGIKKTFAHFFPSSVIAYTYAAISIISIFMGLEGVFAIAIRTVTEILMFVFAYLGLSYVMTLIRASERRMFLTSILIVGFLFMTGTAVQIISYFGAWIVVSTHLIKPKA